MGIRIKVDEDLPAEMPRLLSSAGHDAVSLIELGLSGAKDAQLWPVIQHEKRCLFTADKGFADVRVHPPGTHHGIVLFRLERESRAGYLRLAEFLLERFDFKDADGAIVVVSSNAIRVHRAL